MDSVALTNPDPLDRIINFDHSGLLYRLSNELVRKNIVTRNIRQCNRAFPRELVARIAMISVRAPRTRSFLTYFRLSSVGPALLFPSLSCSVGASFILS